MRFFVLRIAAVLPLEVLQIDACGTRLIFLKDRAWGAESLGPKFQEGVSVHHLLVASEHVLREFEDIVALGECSELLEMVRISLIMGAQNVDESLTRPSSLASGPERRQERLESISFGCERSRLFAK